jgi:NAD(P)-dependent dehydrogenase (short-subunit alcohol dehydrogenase family)
MQATTNDCKGGTVTSLASVGDSLSAIFDVRGQQALVTGGAGGIGLAVAEALLDCGADVTIADINAERLASARAHLSDRAGTVRSAVLDVTDRAEVPALVNRIVAEHGRIDIVFANAGVPSLSDRIEGELDGLDDGWDRVIAVNLNGAFATVKAAAKPMRSQGSGRIIVTSSTAGLRADPMVANAYVAAKAALVNLTRQAALHLAPYGVRVNAMAPGPFHTGFGAASTWWKGSGGADGEGTRVPPPETCRRRRTQITAGCRRFRSGASVRPRRSRAWPCCSPRTRRRISPGRPSRLTAARSSTTPGSALSAPATAHPSMPADHQRNDL